MSVVLRGINFGRVFCSSGALGFYGDGYWYHKYLKWMGLDYTGATFVAKTTTLEPRKGNMELLEDGISPRGVLPSCIKVKPFRGAVLNAVGLSGPGAVALLNSGAWQARRSPFLISFMSVKESPFDRMQELKSFVGILRNYLPDFRSPIGLEINFSCPNVGIEFSDLLLEVVAALDAASNLDIPLVPNFSPDIPVSIVASASKHYACDAVSIANTVKWGKLPNEINWQRLWGGKSPLSHLGGGGISGYPLRPVVQRWVAEAQEHSFRCPIIAGGGVMSKSDAKKLLVSGAAAVKLGVVGMLRPWRVRSIIRSIL